MWYPAHSSAWGALSQHIGGGRVHEQVRLNMAQQGGEGLIWPLRIAGYACRAWCTEQAWIQWIAPLLPVSGFAGIDNALLLPLALWSWQRFIEVLPEGRNHQLQISPPGKEQIPEEWGPQLSLRRLEDKGELSLRLIDWPEAWLIEQTQEWELMATLSSVPPVAMSVVAGWCSLPYQTLAMLGVGEGLRLSGSVNLWSGQAWLFQQQPLARVRFTQNRQAVIEAMMAENQEWPADRGVDLPGLSITLVAEIGQLWLSLEQLTHLQEGTVLEGDSAFTGEVSLKANGYYLGSGQLIEIGGSWIIQIERWFTELSALPLSEGLKQESVVHQLVSPECLTASTAAQPESLVEADSLSNTMAVEMVAAESVHAVDAAAKTDQPVSAESVSGIEREESVSSTQAVETVAAETPSSGPDQQEAVHDLANALPEERVTVAEVLPSGSQRTSTKNVRGTLKNVDNSVALLTQQVANSLQDSSVIEPKTVAVTHQQDPVEGNAPRPPRPPKVPRSKMARGVKAPSKKRPPSDDSMPA